MRLSPVIFEGPLVYWQLPPQSYKARALRGALLMYWCGAGGNPGSNCGIMVYGSVGYRVQRNPWTYLMLFNARIPGTDQLEHQRCLGVECRK